MRKISEQKHSARAEIYELQLKNLSNLRAPAQKSDMKKYFSQLFYVYWGFVGYASIYEKFWIKICFRIQYNRPLYLPQTYKILVFRLHKRKTFDLQATGTKKRQIAIIPFSPVRMR